MNSLSSAPLAPLLIRLFAEAEAADAPLRTDLARRSPEERAALMEEARNDYRSFYARAKDMYLPVSPETGRLLYLLVRATKARHIVEFGSSFGLSTLYLAAGLKDNGAGRVIGTEFDGAKELYPRVLALLESRLREGALVLADNADHNPDFLAYVRDPRHGYLSVPFASDVELFVRLPTH